MSRSKFHLLFVLLSFCFANSFGQANVSGFEVDLQEKTPQSPNSGNLGKYFDIPVNLATGIPNISIPLYSIKSGNIVVPIVLNYHAGGIQVDEIAGFVGLGWSLSAGGSIIKKTNGLDDFYETSGIGVGTPFQNYMSPDYSNISYNGGYTNMNDEINALKNSTTVPNQDSLYHFFSWVAKGNLDAEADEFIYNIPGGNGKFYYNQKEDLFQTRELNGVIVTGNASAWTIKTKDGKIYTFNRPELTVNPSFFKSLTAQQFLTTAWHLTNINDPSSGKEVNFYYDNYYKSDVPMGVTEVHDWDFTSGPPVNYAVTSIDNWRSGDNYVLGTISFDKGTVYFIKDTTTRSDYGPNLLKEILVFNNRDLLLKKIEFSYFTNSSRPFLKSVQEFEYDGNGENLIHQPYLFTYDTAINLPSRFSYAQDKWGYYNGKTSNTTLIPSHPMSSTYTYMLAADRDIDSNYTKAGMLNGIVHPTGGKTLFEFENNSIGTSTLVGGLRIKRITHFDSVAQKSLITEYKYAYPGSLSSSGSVLSNPIFNYDLLHVSGDIMGGFYYAYLLRTESTPVNSLFPNQGSPVFYGCVEKKEKGGSVDLMSRHYFYEVTEAGETYENLYSVPHPKQLEVIDIAEYLTELFTSTNDTTYSLIKRDSLNYSTLVSTQNAVWNAQTAWYCFFNGFSEWPGGDPATFTPMAAYFAPSLHAYKVMPCQSVKTDQHTSTMANGFTLTVPEYYEYDSTNGNLKVLKTVDSKADTSITMIKYACDYISTGSPSINYEIQSLINYNMKSAPIEIIKLLKKKDSTNSIVQSAVLYEYDGLKIKKIYKVFDQVPYNSFTVSYNDVSGFYKDSHYQLQQEITAWDTEARPRTVITNTDKTSFTWDEKYQLPTSIIANASYEDVAYTSFEGQSNGSWTVTSSNRDSTHSMTGRLSYQLSNGGISKTGLSSGITYIVSYWSRNGSSSSYSVSGSSSVTEGRTIDGWTYYEHTVSGVSTVTVSGSNYIDELRVYPKAAQMISYCYEELLGMTAKCDQMNHIIYYQYYGPDKLKLVIDEDKNIIKKICYNYAGQPENCASDCTDSTANWQNTSTAVRCEKDSTWQNTGYLEQEQRDMNPCSSTFYQSRWVTASQDTTTCPPPVYVNLTSTNVVGFSGYTASYYNTSTGYTYNFSVPPATGLQTLGTVPAGNYTLTITRTSGTPLYGTFKSGCWKQIIAGTSATFYNVGVSSITCNSITVDISGE